MADLFPILSHERARTVKLQIPRLVAEIAHAEYSRRHGPYCQGLEYIAKRGGFGYLELCELLSGPGALMHIEKIEDERQALEDERDELAGELQARGELSG